MQQPRETSAPPLRPPSRAEGRERAKHLDALLVAEQLDACPEPLRSWVRGLMEEAADQRIWRDELQGRLDVMKDQAEAALR